MGCGEGALAVGALLRGSGDAGGAIKLFLQERAKRWRHVAVMGSAATAAGRQGRLSQRAGGERGGNQGEQGRPEEQDGEKASLHGLRVLSSHTGASGAEEEKEAGVRREVGGDAALGAKVLPCPDVVHV